jgi:hypothetical protein
LLLVAKRPKTRLQKPSKTTEGGGEKNRGKKSRIFCDESRWTFSGGKKYRAFEPPLSRNAQRRDTKEIDERKKKVSNYFFFGAAANVRHFRHFGFHGPPCGDTTLA